jgi:hypothetical protein
MGSRSEQGYLYASSSSLINEPRDPFGSSEVAPQRRYYDNELDNQDEGRNRDAGGSDINHSLLDGERYYDNNNYEPYNGTCCAIYYYFVNSYTARPP